MGAAVALRSSENNPFARSWRLGSLELPNRLVLAPLAGIGKWFVRLQARRFGAGFVVSEMVSSHGIVRGNERTLREFLRIHPDEHPLAIQLFGDDPAVMREAAAVVAQAGADAIDINMGCPVRKVCRAGAGAALLEDPDRAVAIARAAVEGSGLPVTCKVRSGLVPGDRSGVDLARRLAAEAGVAGIGFHPRHASQQHKGQPDYALAAALCAELDVPVVLSGGLHDEERVLRAWREVGADAVMLARGALGNPWLFARLLGRYTGEPSVDEVLDELEYVIAGACEHLGRERADHYLRKFYPWYAERLRAQVPRPERTRLCEAPTVEGALAVVAELRRRFGGDTKQAVSSAAVRAA